MQNENTLVELGFRKKPSLREEEFLYRGRNQKFIAKVVAVNGPSYVSLSLVSPAMDTRPLSNNKGKHFRSVIKDCISFDSVKRAITTFDLPEDRIIRNGFTILIKSN